MSLKNINQKNNKIILINVTGSKNKISNQTHLKF